jgi:hypothetical protein
VNAYAPWLRGVPEMTQWLNVKPLAGVAVISKLKALVKAYVPAGGLVVPPDPGKITTIAAVCKFIAGGTPGGVKSWTNIALTV